MAVKAVTFKVPPTAAEPAPFEIPRIDLGLNLRDEHSQIQNGQSPYNYRTGKPGSVNMVSDGIGGVKKRDGVAKVYDASLGAGAVHGVWDYVKYDGTAIRLMHWGAKLYTQSGGSQPVEIGSGLADAKGIAWVMGDVWYYLDGTNYWQYDGAAFAAVTPHVPTMITAKNPDGTGGVVEEELNLLTDSWIEEFAGTAGDTVYVLSMEADSVTIAKDGVTVPLESYTFPTGDDYAKITFGTAPGVHTVAVTCAKAGLNDATEVRKCRYASLFGGKNDTRIFITGNPDYPSRVWWCDILNPANWPVNNFNDVGSDADFNRGLAFQYDQMVALKERSLHRIEYYFNETANAAEFLAYPLNAGIGCDCPGSIQIIDNYIVFLNSQKGVQIVERTDVRTEKNVRSISDLINRGPGRPGLLDENEDALRAATSFDDGKYYVLCVGNHAWVWNYRDTPWQGNPDALQWWYWENINANCWIQKAGVTCFGDRSSGHLWKFIDNKNDDGAAIDGRHLTRLFHFDYQEYLKTINLIYFRTNVTNAGNITVTAYDDLAELTFIRTVTSDSFNWDTFNWDTFTWDVNVFDPVFRLKAKMKKIKYLQMEFSNSSANEDLSILDVKIYFSLNRKVK